MDKSGLRDIGQLSIFRCKLCKFRLDIPIMHIKSLGAICGSCYAKSAFTHAIHDYELERDMDKLDFSCRYQQRGCTFQSRFTTICDHESECNFRIRTCPLVLENECDYAPTTDLIKHFHNYHMDRVLVTDNNSFAVQKPFEMKDNMFYLINIKLRYFLLQVKFDRDQLLHFYAFYYFGRNNDPYTFTLLLKNDDFVLTYKAATALHESKLSTSINENHAIAIDHLVFNHDNTVTFAVNYSQGDFKEEIKCFECAICFYYMVDEIYICSKGHSICHICRKKLDKCPMCKANFSGRNYSMESLAKHYKFPCKNSDYCNKQIKGYMYKSHMFNCFYEIRTCPFLKTADRCLWKGLYDSLATHLRNNHEGLVHEHRTTELIIPLQTDLKYTCCFITGTDVIVCLYVINDDLTLSLDIRLVLESYTDRFLCTVDIGEEVNICTLQFPLPFCTHRAVKIASYTTNDAIKLRFSFKRTRDTTSDKLSYVPV